MVNTNTKGELQCLTQFTKSLKDWQKCFPDKIINRAWNNTLPVVAHKAPQMWNYWNESLTTTMVEVCYEKILEPANVLGRKHS
jgi:hypothetical protein